MTLLNNISNLSDTIYWSLNSFFCTLSMWCRMRFVGVKHGRKLSFYGMTTFKKASTATINIGSKCSFRSKHTSNLIGINRPCIITALQPKAELKIGDNCGFSGTVIGCFTKVTLGNNVRCGANTLITDSDWHLDDPRTGLPKPILIEDNVWLGVNVAVMKGVTIGQNSVIGAGSVVTKNIPANVIAAGNPCNVISEIKNKS